MAIRTKKDRERELLDMVHEIQKMYTHVDKLHAIAIQCMCDADFEKYTKALEEKKLL